MKHRGQLASDDWWALVAAVFDLLVIGGCSVRFYFIRHLNEAQLLSSSKRALEASYLVTTIGFPLAIWTSRTSITCSVLRILPSGRTRAFVFTLTWIFLANGLVTAAVQGAICGSRKTWSNCSGGEGFIVYILLAHVLSNVLLIVIPLSLLWRSKLPFAPKYMLRTVFVTNICTVPLCVVHAFYTAVALLICNLLVMATFLYRYIQRRDFNKDISEYLSTPEPGEVLNLTNRVTFDDVSTERHHPSGLIGRGSSLFASAEPKHDVQFFLSGGDDHDKSAFMAFSHTAAEEQSLNSVLDTQQSLRKTTLT
ncbi:hypothetical protein H0H93_011320 [Arthromyces matolae]|nr:hypothetical protein H0H93_011320 [Arthromyces matolae]